MSESKAKKTSGPPPDHAIQRTKPEAPLEPKPGKTLSEDEKVDEASRESMDASDPPSYMPTHAGKPNKTGTVKKK
ncbi:MAG: hypothetical protein WAW96_21020 [Alphaproteobacteria bacterium]